MAVNTRTQLTAVATLLAAGLALAAWFGLRQPAGHSAVPLPPGTSVQAALFRELQPVPLVNCDLQRFGEPHDGGYLMCANLLRDVAAGYSYGIGGEDSWGCGISALLEVPVHQYDCLDQTPPACAAGRTIFHAECVAGHTFRDAQGRPFDTLENQLARNGHAAQRVVLKMDVEGSEWESLRRTPDEVLRRIDQLAIEFHGVDQVHYLDLVRRLRQFFHVAHLHFNNYTCLETDEHAPFPARAYQVLLVNQRLAEVDPHGRVELPHPQDAPSAPDRPDCQRVPPVM